VATSELGLCLKVDAGALTALRTQRSSPTRPMTGRWTGCGWDSKSQVVQLPRTRGPRSRPGGAFDRDHRVIGLGPLNRRRALLFHQSIMMPVCGRIEGATSAVSNREEVGGDDRGGVGGKEAESGERGATWRRRDAAPTQDPANGGRTQNSGRHLKAAWFILNL